MNVAPLPSIPRRRDLARAHHERGGLVAAVLPIHYPRALLRAFGILPMEVWGPPNVDAARAASRLQPYVCSIVRNALSFLESGGLQIADLLIVPHACDSLQGLGSVLLDFVHPAQPVLPLYLPRNPAPEGTAFLADEFRALHQRLAEVTQRTPSESELMQAILDEEVADDLLRRVHEQRPTLPLTTFDFYHLVRAREFLPLDSFVSLARAILAMPAVKSPPKIPIVLSGIVPEPMDMLRAVDELGASVIADDLACCGRRLYPAGRSRDPFMRLAESLLGGSPDSTRGSPIQDRLDHLLGLAHSTGSRGVVFHDVKFCEPELFDLPVLRRGLRDAGLPSITVEVDLNDAVSHQARTRLEAFLEMIA
ncbi:MAG: 2-hydroxyacyl-CoA dehydratase family protein [Chloroflexi bacterium]|nr:2-hydroxyacyl-CoA dehydratase family protein [Chloroflexota bacterium]